MRYIAWPTGEQDVVRTRIARHRELDEIAQGYGYEVGWDRDQPERVRACAVGCSLDRYDHTEYSRVLGVDLRVARLVDRIHESLPHEDAINWPGRVAAALTPGADATLVADRFLAWLLRHGRCGLDENCARVAALYADRLLGQEPPVVTWRQAMCAVARAAYAAYAAAADAASDADAYAAYAADAAARAAAAAADAAAYAADAARAAADAAAYAADAAAAAAYAASDADAPYAAAGKVAFWRNAADVLIELLSRCEVVS